MSTFLDPLRMELMSGPDGLPLLTRDGRQLFCLLSRFRYLSDVAGLIDVPTGYVTDLCSKPQCVLSLLGDGEQEPSVPHDYAYSTHCVPRDVADKMLYEACILTGTPRWRATAIYLGVRIGGGSHWVPDTAPLTPEIQAAA